MHFVGKFQFQQPQTKACNISAPYIHTPQVLICNRIQQDFKTKSKRLRNSFFVFFNNVPQITFNK